MARVFFTVKNPGVSAVLSALIPGLGQIYNGQIGKGIFFIILSAMLIQAYLTGINAFGVIVSVVLWIMQFIMLTTLPFYRTKKLSNKPLMKCHFRQALGGI